MSSNYPLLHYPPQASVKGKEDAPSAPASIQFEVFNTVCVECEHAIIEGERSLILFTCSHVSHARCVLLRVKPLSPSSLLEIPDKCMNCISKMLPPPADASKNALDAEVDSEEEDEREQDVYDKMLQYGLNFPTTEQKKFFLTEAGIDYDRFIEPKGIPHESKRKLGSFEDLLRFKKQDLDRQWIDEKRITMSQLLNANVQPDHLWGALQCRTLKDLRSLGFKREHLRRDKQGRRGISFEELFMFFSARFPQLEELGIKTLRDLASSLQPTTRELKYLGLGSFHKLKKAGLRDVSDVALFNFSPEEWAQDLRMKKRHLYQLRIDNSNLRLLRWTSIDIAKAFNLDSNDRKKLKITAFSG